MEEQEIRLECARPLESDARLVMSWRNDPDTLRWSFNTAPKVWDSYWKLFRSEYFCFHDLPPLFACAGGERIAFLRMTPASDPEHLGRKTCDISIVVAPNRRGKGVGTAILQAASSWLVIQGYELILAKIKVDNESSLRSFQKAGFSSYKKVEEEVFKLNTKAEVFYFLKELSPRHVRKPVFVIAEAGSNWVIGSDQKKNVETAYSLIQAAADCGADAVKFQVFRADTIYVPNAGEADYLAKGGMRRSIGDIFKELEMPDELLPQLAERARECGIQFMASPFSKRDFQVVDPLVQIHKIASYEIGFSTLLELAAKSKKPIFMSTGAATEDEIAWAVDFLHAHESGPVTLLQCTASYPAPLEDLNLSAIPWLQKRFKLPVGLSDHSANPVTAPACAVALGATVIEKHFTLDRSSVGPDHKFAVTPQDLKELVKVVRMAEIMRGDGIKSVMPSEQELRLFACRGVQALRPIAAGEVFVEGENIAVMRPGKQIKGVHARFLESMQGKPAKRPLLAGEGVRNGDW